MHGRLGDAEKERVMAAFRANRMQVLLATSVVEVGVDVPNATVMVIENAEQFGLAQLHQLRGRIGRGAADSYCILISAGKTEEAARRLKILEQTTDGFRIAEADLKLRGPGELLGRRAKRRAAVALRRSGAGRGVGRARPGLGPGAFQAGMGIIPHRRRSRESLGCAMKRIILSLALGLLLINLTSGCNQSADTNTTSAATNQPSTNAVPTNAPATK